MATEEKYKVLIYLTPDTGDPAAANGHTGELPVVEEEIPCLYATMARIQHVTKNGCLLETEDAAKNRKWGFYPPHRILKVEFEKINA